MFGFLKKQKDHFSELLNSSKYYFFGREFKKLSVKEKIKKILTVIAISPVFLYPQATVALLVGTALCTYQKKKYSKIAALTPEEADTINTKNYKTKEAKESLKQSNEEEINRLNNQKKEEQSKNKKYQIIGDIVPKVSGISTFLSIFVPAALPVALVSFAAHTYFSQKEIQNEQNLKNIDNQITNLNNVNRKLDTEINFIEQSERINKSKEKKKNKDKKKDKHNKTKSDTKDNATKQNHIQPRKSEKTNNSVTNSAYNDAVELYIDSLCNNNQSTPSKAKVLTK